MEKFDTALDRIKLALDKTDDVRHVNWSMLCDLIHAIDLLGDEVAKLKEKKNDS